MALPNSVRSETSDSLLKGFDYIELYVGNARQTTHFLRTAFGFTPIAYAGLETNLRDRASFIVQQNDIRLMITEALSPDSPLAEHVKTHGDGIKDIAFSVDDAVHCFNVAVERGAKPIMEPTRIEGSEGTIIKATIATFGDTVHSLIQRIDTPSDYFPNFQPLSDQLSDSNVGFTEIDHVAISLEPGTLDQWASFYIDVFDFHQSHQEDIITEYSGMNSKVVQNSSGTIKFPMQEPVSGKRRSQIEEFLNYNHGAGAQHLALLSDDIVNTIQVLRSNGIDFVRTPDTYYDVLSERVGEIEEDIDMLRALNILVDRDKTGYLLQLFTKPLQSRPTLFFEIIARKNATGFGSGNIKALFAALEREQILRGNI